jgi:hypothetical protein
MYLKGLQLNCLLKERIVLPKLSLFTDFCGFITVCFLAALTLAFDLTCFGFFNQPNYATFAA